MTNNSMDIQLYNVGATEMTLEPVIEMASLYERFYLRIAADDSIGRRVTIIHKNISDLFEKNSVYARQRNF